MNIDPRRVEEGATHWSPAVEKSSRLEAYWRPDGKGRYDCWAVSNGHLYWQKNAAPLPGYAVEIKKESSSEDLPPIDSIVRIDPGATQIWDVAQQFIGVDCYLKAVFTCGETQMVAVEAVEIGQCCCFWASMVRTPEQIAVEKHRAAIEDLAADTDWILTKEACEAVLAAGYRKQVIDD